MSFLDLLRGTLAELGGPHRRRPPFLAPALERRRPRIAAEDYAARHSIEHTLERKAELRLLAPTMPGPLRFGQQGSQPVHRMIWSAHMTVARRSSI